jgi:LysM repeat protein
MIISKIGVTAAAVAAMAVSGQAAASAATTTAAHPTMRNAHTLAAVTKGHHRATRRHRHTTYTVRAGDTLSSIGARFRIPWESLYAANEPRIGADPNLIYAGEVLLLRGGPVRSAQAPIAEAQPAESEPVQQADPVAQPAPAQPAAPAAGTGAGSGFQQCVIQHESGGNAQVMNSSGHYGLYQFSQSTWDAAGGNPADFGHASVSEQNQVFQNAYAKWGTSPWAPYDGC